MTSPFDVPHTQNTAPVIEFRCLYSTDLKRKQKRWQDGRLKYHTFNRRIMVYDEKSNFIGDTHWREDGDLDEGEELSLERGGALIQVEDKIGIQAQDLTELVDKRIKEKEARAAARSAAVGSPASINGRTQPFRTQGNTLKLKSLNAFSTQSGHHGRAFVSIESPYEERHCLTNGNQENPEKERPSKRRKVNESTQNKGGYAQSLTGTILALASSKPSSKPTIRYERLKTSLAGPQKPLVEIDLTADGESADESTHTRENIMREAPGAENRKSKKARLRRSPLAKNGYASNLTGVTLSLSGSPGASKITRAREPTIKKAHNSRAGNDSNSDIDRYDQRLADKKTTEHPARMEDVTAPMNNRRSLSRSESIELSSSLGENLTTPHLPVHGEVTKTKPPKAPVMQAVEKRQKLIKKVSSAQNHKQEPTTSREKTTKDKPPSEEINRPSSHSFGSDTLISKTNDSAIQPSFKPTANSLKPRSSLKLKSKKPQQMMMLMNQYGSRPSLSNSNPIDNVASQIKKNTTNSTGEVGGSEAIDDVDSFVQQQEALMHARLSRKQPQEYINLDNSFSSLARDLDAPPYAENQATEQQENAMEHLNNPSHEKRIEPAPSSATLSSLYSGITHRTIDRILSHSTDPITLLKENISSRSLVTLPGKSQEAQSLQPHEATSDDTSKPSQKPPNLQHQPDRGPNAALEMQSIMRTTPPGQSKDNPLLRSTTNMKANLATMKYSTVTPEGGASGEASLSTSLASTKVHRTTEERLSHTQLPNIVEEAKIATNTSVVEERKGESTKNLTPEESAVPLPVAPQQTISNAHKQLTSKAQRPAGNVTEALKDTVEHFRATVRPSPHNLTQVNKNIIGTRQVENSQKPEIDQSNKPKKQASDSIPPAADLQASDPISNVAALDNTSMKPPSGLGFRLTHSFGLKWPTIDPLDTSEFALSIATVNQPKFKLSKPAPRPVTLVSGPEGSSYGKMLPPRCGGQSSNNDLSRGMPVTATGPWSRQAFDLFGNWTPSNKPATT